jgi:nitrogen fixation/metabolism regulation signal transduction histidine kinase
MAINSLIAERLWLTRVTFFLIWGGLLYNLIQYVSRTNKMLNSFMESVKYLDMLPGKDEGDESFRDLNLSLNQIISNVKEAKRDREAQSVYFRNVVEHVHTGLISFDKKGKIRMYNRAAKELLKLPLISEIQSLSRIKSGLDNEIIKMQPGDNLMATVIIDNDLRRLIIRKAEMIIMEEKIFVISLQDIRSQLEEEELETWQKLISILRHEIMNSVAPLNSLSISLRKIVDKINADIPKKEASMLHEGLEAISRRSDGMMKFVQAYKTLTSIPKPEFTEFPVNSLVRESMVLFKPEIQKRNIQMILELEEDLMLTADFNLISQILINLIKNALESIQDEKGKIIIRALKNQTGYIVLSIEDNGTGIPDEELEKIFIPFYTTKEDGSGIGLSLARQIMRLHKGKISVVSEPGNGSRFSLHF